jgi:hypothetical protein
MMNTIPLDEAAALLHGMVPDEAANWRRKIFGPDYILERAQQLGATIDLTRIPEWENINDGELVEALLADDASLTCDTLVITDACLGAQPPGVPPISGAFSVRDGRVREFIEAYRREVAAHFVDGDVIVASPSDGEIRVFHHEGLVARLRLPGRASAHADGRGR